jgi:hypothetical protein
MGNIYEEAYGGQRYTTNDPFHYLPRGAGIMKRYIEHGRKNEATEKCNTRKRKPES